jgi:cyanosortase A-associated protein
MNFWKQLRVPFLAIIGGSALLTLGKIILFPPPPYYAPPLAFPENVPLSGWQLVDSRPLNLLPADKKLDVVAGRHYRYRQGNRALEIAMRYVAGKVDSRELAVKTLLAAPDGAALPSLEERQQPGIGFYALGTEHSEAFLSACISPSGETTVTGEQFRANRQPQPNRVLLWLLGLEPLRDNRCLWVYLSLPLKDAAPDTAYLLLENAWFSWYKYWQPRFQNNQQ